MFSRYIRPQKEVRGAEMEKFNEALENKQRMRKGIANWRGVSKMKKIKPMFIIVFILIAGVMEGQAQSQNPLLNTLNRIADCMGIAAAGYDCDCVFGIRQMVTEGKLSPGEAQFLISQKCQIRSQQQLPQQRDCTICPICGTAGFIGPMIGGVFHYSCPMGHIWPCDR